jgi:3-(3-hydroxy-phenyl)propionate hydroxylase
VAQIPVCRTSITSWKLATVLRSEAPEALLDSYHLERAFAADDNILNSTRATDFITPKTPASRLYRDAVLDLARYHAFARPLVPSIGSGFLKGVRHFKNQADQ